MDKFVTPKGFSIFRGATEVFPYDPDSKEAKDLFEKSSQTVLRNRFCFQLVGPPPKKSNTKQENVPCFYWIVQEKRAKKTGETRLVSKPIPKHLLRHFHKDLGDKFKQYLDDPFKMEMTEEDEFMFDPRFIESKKSKIKPKTKTTAGATKNTTQRTHSPTIVGPTFEVDPEHIQRFGAQMSASQRDPTWSLFMTIAKNFPGKSVDKKMTKTLFENAKYLGLWKLEFLDRRGTEAPEVDVGADDGDDDDDDDDDLDLLVASQDSVKPVVISDEETLAVANNSLETPSVPMRPSFEMSPLWISMNSVCTVLRAVGRMPSKLIGDMTTLDYDQTDTAKNLFTAFFRVSTSETPSTPLYEDEWVTFTSSDAIHRRRLQLGDNGGQKTVERQDFQINSADTLLRQIEELCTRDGIVDSKFDRFTTFDNLTRHRQTDVIHAHTDLMLQLFDRFFELRPIETCTE